MWIYKIQGIEALVKQTAHVDGHRFGTSMSSYGLRSLLHLKGEQRLKFTSVFLMENQLGYCIAKNTWTYSIQQSLNKSIDYN